MRKCTTCGTEKEQMSAHTIYVDRTLDFCSDFCMLLFHSANSFILSAKKRNYVNPRTQFLDFMARADKAYTVAESFIKEVKKV